VINTVNVYRFNYSGSLTLTAGTTYWLVVESSDLDANPVFDWNYADDPGGATRTPTAGTSGSGVTYAGTRGIEAFETTWLNLSANSGLRYGVIVVPEPSTYALGLVGTLVMGAVARRKGRKTASA